MRSRSTKFKKNRKIQNSSELSSNENSLDISKKTLAVFLTKNLCYPPHAKTCVILRFFSSQTWRKWFGLCSSATCSSTMACLAIGHSHSDDKNPVTGYRHPIQHCTTTQSPTRSTPNHSFTTNEQASFPPQTTWCCPSQKKKTHTPEEASHHHPKKQTSTSSFVIASPTHLLNAPCSSHKPLHTLVRTSCNPAAKRTRLRIAASELL